MGIARAPAVAVQGIDFEPIELSAQQIKPVIAGKTLFGKIGSDLEVNIFFAVQGTFAMTTRAANGAQRSFRGSWFVEPEADLLCLAMAQGEDGRQCWIVRLGKTIELSVARGSLREVGLPLRSITFTVAASGDASASRPVVVANARVDAGESFRDCPVCPEMVIVPAGSFIMGSPESESGREKESPEAPQHQVTFAKPFSVGRFPVTFAEWDACMVGGGCGGYRPEDQGWGRGDRPVVNVRWSDAQAYVSWLSSKAGRTYRLLSEAEFEYVARAATKTPFWWGTSISTAYANYNGNFTYERGAKGEYRERTLPVKSFQPNPWGLYQVHGNVYSWTGDCWNNSYKEAPTDGSTQIAGDCSRRVIRGGAWSSDPKQLRAAFRNWFVATYRADFVGFRVAASLN